MFLFYIFVILLSIKSTFLLNIILNSRIMFSTTVDAVQTRSRPGWCRRLCAVPRVTCWSSTRPSTSASCWTDRRPVRIATRHIWPLPSTPPAKSRDSSCWPLLIMLRPCFLSTSAPLSSTVLARTPSTVGQHLGPYLSCAGPTVWNSSRDPAIGALHGLLAEWIARSTCVWKTRVRIMLKPVKPTVPSIEEGRLNQL